MPGYIQHTWATAEVISAARLNNIETMLSALATQTLVTASGTLAITVGGIYIFAKTVPADPNLVTLPTAGTITTPITIIDGTGNFNIHPLSVSVSGGGNILGKSSQTFSGASGSLTFLWVGGAVNQYIAY